MLEKLKEKELNLGQLFECASDIYKQNFKIILFVTVLIFFPVALISQVALVRVNEITEAYTLLSVTGDIAVENAISFIQSASMYMGISVLLLIAVEPLGIMAIIMAAKKRIDGEEVSYKEAILFAFKKGPTVIVVNLILLGIFVIPWILCISAAIMIAASLFMDNLFMFTMIIFIPVVLGIVISTYWIFSTYAVVISDKIGFNALQSSHKIVKGKWLKTFGVYSLIMFLVYMIAVCISGILPVSVGLLYADILANVVMYIIQSFVFILLTLIYLNRTLFKEEEEKKMKEFEEYKKGIYQSNTKEEIKEEIKEDENKPLV